MSSSKLGAQGTRGRWAIGPACQGHRGRELEAWGGAADCHQNRHQLLPAPRSQQHLRWLQTPEGEPAGQAGPQVPPAKIIPSADALLRRQTVKGGGGRNRSESLAAGDSAPAQPRHPWESQDRTPTPELSRRLGVPALRMWGMESCATTAASNSTPSTLSSPHLARGASALPLYPTPTSFHSQPLFQVSLTGAGGKGR